MGGTGNSLPVPEGQEGIHKKNLTIHFLFIPIFPGLSVFNRPFLIIAGFLCCAPRQRVVWATREPLCSPCNINYCIMVKKKVKITKLEFD